MGVLLEQSNTATVSNPSRLVFLSGGDIESLDVAPADVISVVEAAFKCKTEGRAEIPPKPTIHPRPDCFLRALPGYLESPDVAGLKWTSAYPSNRQAGLPTVGALVILNNPQTGLPLAILEGSRITAWRTAGVSAMATRLLARDGASVLAICGAGVQGDVHLEFLVHALPGLKEARVYDTDWEVVNRFLDRHGPRHPQLSLQAAASPRSAVRDADVIITAAPMREKPLAILTADELAPGVLCLPIDLDSYFGPSAFAACQLFFSDDANQLLALQEQGRFAALPHIDGDYGHLLAGKVQGRSYPGERIMAISVGVALGDLAVAHLLYRKAGDCGKGQLLEL